MIGASVNYGEINDIVDTTDGVYWDEVPSCQACRGTLRDETFTGCTASGGEFTWYDP